MFHKYEYSIRHRLSRATLVLDCRLYLLPSPCTQRSVISISFRCCVLCFVEYMCPFSLALLPLM